MHYTSRGLLRTHFDITPPPWQGAPNGLASWEFRTTHSLIDLGRRHICLTSWHSYRPDVITLIVIMRHEKQWATAVEAYHFVPINSPPAPSGLCQPARSLCHYERRFVWTTLKNTGSQQRQQTKTGSVIEDASKIHGDFVHGFTTSKRQNY